MKLQVLLGIYCKRFYWIPLFTMLLLFYVFEVGKAKSATQSVLMILTLNGLFQKNFQVFYFTPENSISLTLPPSPSVWFFYYSVCTVISDCNHPFDTSIFTLIYSLQRTHYCNWKYISEWSFFEIKSFYFSIKETPILKSNYFW